MKMLLADFKSRARPTPADREAAQRGLANGTSARAMSPGEFEAAKNILSRPAPINPKIPEGDVRTLDRDAYRALCRKIGVRT